MRISVLCVEGNNICMKLVKVMKGLKSLENDSNPYPKEATDRFLI